MPKSSAERVKAYRDRKRQERGPKVNKNGAQRTREWRARKRLAKANVMVHNLSTTDQLQITDEFMNIPEETSSITDQTPLSMEQVSIKKEVTTDFCSTSDHEILAPQAIYIKEEAIDDDTAPITREINTGEELIIGIAADIPTFTSNEARSSLNSESGPRVDNPTNTQAREKQFTCRLCKQICQRITNFDTHPCPKNSDYNRYECTFCEHKFKSKSILYNHMSTAHENEILEPECPVCEEFFRLKEDLFKHIVEHSETQNQKVECVVCERNLRLQENMDDISIECFDCKMKLQMKESLNTPVRDKFECAHCKTTFESKESLNLHVKTHLDMPLKCAVCNIKCETQEFLNLHANTHKENETFECDRCSKTFHNKDLLNSHMKVHLENAPLNCSHCKLYFLSKKSYEDHMYVHHNDQTKKTVVGKTVPNSKNECPKCGLTFRATDTLHRHMEVVHSIKQILKCSLCKMTFDDQAKLDWHTNTAFTCLKCKLQFHTEKTLEKHLEVVHGVKENTANTEPVVSYADILTSNENEVLTTNKVPPVESSSFLCTECPKVFHDKSKFIIHMSKHRSKILHTCTVCPRQFKSSNSLTQHFISHNVLQCYGCYICLKKFVTYKEFLRHIELHESGELSNLPTST